MDRKTKENVLDLFIDELRDDASPYPESVIHKAMDIWAKETAIRFAVFREKFDVSIGKEYLYSLISEKDNSMREEYTIEQLYEKFISEQKEK